MAELVLASGAVTLVYRWAREAMSGILTVPPELYAGALTFVLGMMIAINWYWINERRPSKRFHSMCKDLETIDEKISKGLKNDREFWIEIRTIIERLKRLKIKHPHLKWPVTDLVKSNWDGFLSWIIVFSRTSDIREARKVAAEQNYLSNDR